MNAYKQFFKRFSLVAVGWLMIGVVLIGQIGVEIEDVACTGQSNGKITVSIESGIAGDFEYSKDGKSFQSSNVFDGLAADSYLITVRDKQTMCKYSKSATVKGGVGLAVNIQGGGTFTFCDTEGPPDITLTASASGGEEPYTFKGWAGGKKEVKSNEPLQKLYVKDKNNCSGSAEWSVQIVKIVCSRDPNDMIGPDGYGDPKFVSVNEILPYKIRFENDPEFASAPAQKVVVEHILDLDLNLFSLNLSNFGFANLIFDVPEKSTFYKKRIDVRDSLGIFVDITAGIDVTENKVFWIFESVDAKTGLAPSDPQQGLLPVNDTITKKGEGFVDFTIIPKATSQTGDSIIAEAAIVFDVNETINTPKIYNVIDALPPISTMNILPQISAELAIPISWTGQDDPGGSGVKDYALFVSENESAYYPHITGVTDTFIVFVGSPGSSYEFFVVATDNVGNMEKKNAAETSTSIDPEAQLSIITFDQNSYCVGDSIGVQWASAGIETIDVLLSEDEGENYTLLEENVIAGTGNFQWRIPIDFTECANCLIKIVDQKEGSTIVDSVSISIFGTPSIFVSDDITMCSGNYIQLNVNEFTDILWTPSLGLSSNTVPNPIASPDKTTTYVVEGTDEYGCKNTATVLVEVSRSSVTEIEEIACITEEAGIFVDTLVNQFFCDSIIITDKVLDSQPPILNCSPTYDITIPQTGNITLSAIDIDPNISDNCGIAKTELSQTDFTCIDIGTVDVLMEVTDLAGNKSSCMIALNILPSNICSIAIANEGGADITAPCSCLSDGEFEEEVTITSLSGETWFVQSTNLLDPLTGQVFETGSSFIENPAGSGLYRLKGIHLSEEGYNITAESPDYTDFSISFSNKCYYPTPNILDLDAEYCLEAESLALNANVNDVEGTGVFRIDDNIFDFFNPSVIGVGKHIISFEFDAATAAANNEEDPGCVSTVSQEVFIRENSHPICMGDGPFFTFNYEGPDTIFVDENCQAIFDLGIDHATVSPKFMPEQEISSFVFDEQLTGFQQFDLVSPGSIIPVSYTVEDNYSNKDTFIVNVVIADNVAPIASCKDITVVLSEEGFASITVDSINENSMDECGIASIVLDKTSFSTADIGDVLIEMTVTDIYGNSSGCLSTVTVKDYSTATEDLPDYVDKLRVYPNPAIDNVTVELQLNTSIDLYIDLLNENGQLLRRIMESNKVSNQYVKEIDLKPYPPGYYMLKIGDENGDHFIYNIVVVK